MRNAVSAISAFEAANEDWSKDPKADVVNVVIHHNLSLANAWLLNMEEAWKYYNKFSANSRSAYKAGALLNLQQTLDFMDKRAAV